MIGDYFKDKQVSAYQPDKDVRDLTIILQKAYQRGHENLHRTWKELNNYSVIGRMNKDQLTFNSFVDESVEDPREAWKWRGTRGQARKNTMAMHAHLTASYIFPNVFAQNEEQEMDRDMSDVAHDLLEWMGTNSNYRSSFLMATMGMLVNPVTYMGADYREVFQKIRVKLDEGYETKEVLDEELSGFNATVYSADQVLIGNAYEQNIQRQYIVPKRRYIDYFEAKAIYGEHENWQFVQSGVQAFYSEEDGLFYETKDEDHETEVEEVIFYCRRDDAEYVYINGVYFGDVDSVENNPMTHRDNTNKPKVPITPFGYERVNEHFFYYKSLVNNVGWDHELLDQMYQITMNKEIMSLLPPLQITGADNVDTEMMLPGSMFVSDNPDFEARPVIPPSNNASGYNAMQSIEQSMSDSSVNEVQRGNLPDASQKAYSVATASQNAQILLQGVGKTLGESVAQYGQLMLDIALNHLTVAQLDELTGKTKYQSFVLEDQTIGGKNVNKRIMFDEKLVGRKMSKKERDKQALKAYEQTIVDGVYEYIARVNPHAWSKMKYMTRVEPDTMIPTNSEFAKAQAQQIYGLLRQDPLVSPEWTVRKLVSTHYRGEEDDAIAEQSASIMGEQGPVQPPEVATQEPGTVAKTPQLANIK